ncbi:MAG TPA: hotdog fold domain-containing protein [Kofleriaceae bacterium]|jgi:acyl-coenzyme A thioesterase PaaI-like protein|nr:hotdog fold domain-containing protein [Kofleriaceae bacterium]
MAITSRLSKLLPVPRLDGGRNLIRDAWNVLSGVPGGRAVFSRLVGRMAPYTSTIRATVTVLRAGYAEVVMADRKAVRNHLNCVHAIALANLAELAGNIALAYSLPDDARFIVSGMQIEYTKKARGTITAIGEPPVPRTAARASYEVPVTLRDESGDEVAKVVLHSLVGPSTPSRAGAASDRRDVN